MKKRLYETDQSIERRDGQMAFSAVARAVYDHRSSAKKGGRIGKILGTDDTFSDEFKAAFNPATEHLWILERVNLRKELEAAKKTINALKKYPGDPDGTRILEDIRANPIRRKKDCILCPIWRHERELSIIDALVSRYVFPRVSNQLYLLTVVFDFVQNLEELEDAISAARKSMEVATAYMNRSRRGVVIAGGFEPDLMSFDQLTTEQKSIRLLQQLGITPTQSGGWTLTGHFFIRVPDVAALRSHLKKQFPAKGWQRIQFKKIDEDAELMKHLIKIFSYVGKMPKPLFDPPTRNTKKQTRAQANADMKTMSAAFYGASFQPNGFPSGFDLDAAILQWAKFIYRMGPKLMFYTVESAHAQKWYSESEMDYIRMTDGDMLRDGRHKIEIHRDQGPFPPYKTLPHLKGRLRVIRSRPLKYDEEWVTMTDCSGINIETHYHDFDRWIIRKK